MDPEEIIRVESLPKIYVTANLYIPKRRSGKLPAVIYVCGHVYSPHGNKMQYQHHGILAREKRVCRLISLKSNLLDE